MEPTPSEFLWYLPNQVEGGHRGDVAEADQNSLAGLGQLARTIEQHGWQGALIGTSWGRFDGLTLATALSAVTERFAPLIAVRPGYWAPAQFASAAATLDHLNGGRTLNNIVSGRDQLSAYGDPEAQSPRRYARTREFIRIVRSLWRGETVSFAGEFYTLDDAVLAPPIAARPGRPYPPLYFGGASPEAEAVAAELADVQLFWGEPLDGVATRIQRLQALASECGRSLPPLRFGLRITTVVRPTRAEAWAAAERRVAAMQDGWSEAAWLRQQEAAVGQQRLSDLAAQGDVVDTCLYTAPARFGGGGAASTWLVGSPDDVAAALRRYEDLGVRHFILSDTPYAAEAMQQGQQLLPLLREQATS